MGVELWIEMEMLIERGWGEGEVLRRLFSILEKPPLGIWQHVVL